MGNRRYIFKKNLTVCVKNPLYIFILMTYIFNTYQARHIQTVLRV